jgi:hypothetical protein
MPRLLRVTITTVGPVFPFAAPESIVVGATSPSSIGEDIPAGEFHAQVELVEAAKRAVTELTPCTFADPRVASEALGVLRATDRQHLVHDPETVTTIGLHCGVSSELVLSALHSLSA